MRFEPLLRGLLAIALTAGLSATVLAQDAGRARPGGRGQGLREAAYSPYAGRNFPTRPFFGDTHLHTGFSLDAGAFGAG